MEMDKTQKIKLGVAIGLFMLAIPVVMWGAGLFDSPPPPPVVTPPTAEEQKEIDKQQEFIQKRIKVRPSDGG